jgi:hypothetical protein
MKTFEQLNKLSGQANIILQSMPTRPQPIASEQQQQQPITTTETVEKKLEPIEEQQSVKDQVTELQRKKQQQKQEQQLVQIEEDERIREQVEKLQRGLLILSEGQQSIQHPEPIALAQFKKPIEEDRFADIRQLFHTDPNAKVIFRFDDTVQKFIAFFEDRIQHVELSPELAYALGYSNQLFVMSGFYAQFMPTLSGGIKQLYVYSPIVEQSIVGNEKAPLLRVINVIGEPGQVQEAIYSSEYHYRLQNKRISEITIEIRSSTGKLVKFAWGNTLVTLHFKRSLFM